MEIHINKIETLVSILICYPALRLTFQHKNCMGCITADVK